jgi:hypothetical protein
MAAPGPSSRPVYVAVEGATNTTDMLGYQDQFGNFAAAGVGYSIEGGLPFTQAKDASVLALTAAIVAQTGAQGAGSTFNPPTGGSGVLGYVSGILKAITGTLTIALPALAAQDGTDATGVSPLAGAVGIRGWLSSIYSKLLGSIAVTGTFWQATQPVSQLDVRQTAQALVLTALNGAFTIALNNGQATIGLQIAGLTASGGGILAVEASNDGGTTWNAKNALVPTSEGTIAQSISSDGAIRINCAGHTNVRLRVSNTGTGSASISYSAASVGGVISLGAALPPGANVIGKVGIDQTTPGATNGVVVNNGSAGLDYSANKPALPSIGANFAASGPYASYVLIGTVPASAIRASVDIENTSGARIAIVRDDGTAANGAAPVNTSVFAVEGGAAAGAQGGSWASTTFKGRLQIYALSSSAQVAVMVE